MDERIGREVYVTKNHGTSPNGLAFIILSQPIYTLSACATTLSPTWAFFVLPILFSPFFSGVQRVRVEQIVGVLAAAEAALMMRKPVIMFLLIKPVTQRTLKANTHKI